MAGCKSLKDISLILKSLKKSVYHLGITTAIDPSSLSKANEARDYRIFEELGLWLINRVRPMYAKERVPGVYLPGWGYSKNAVKIHLWVAISAYLMLAWVKAALKSPLTITEVSKVIEASILSKADIRELLDVPAPLTQNQNVNELLLNF